METKNSEDNQIEIFDVEVKKTEQIEVMLPAVFVDVGYNAVFTQYYLIRKKKQKPETIVVFKDGHVSFNETLLDPATIIKNHKQATIEEWNDAVDKAEKFIKTLKL